MPKVRISVLRRNYFPELASRYCMNPDPGPCVRFDEDYSIVIDQDAYFSMQIPGGFCAEAWHCISHYVYAALQGGAVMGGWMADDRVMIASCNDGVRPVVFKIERLDD